MIVFIHDGTFEGLLTSVYEAYYSKTKPEEIFDGNFNDQLLYNKVYIETNIIKSQKVYDAILDKIGEDTLENIYYAFLSDDYNRYTLIYNYIKLGFKLGVHVNQYLHNDTVRAVIALRERVAKEVHLFLGFVRFKNVADNFLYSCIEPDNNILELISPHFSQRLSNENWIIHDLKRNIASVCKDGIWEITPMSLEYYNMISKAEDPFNSLWRSYYTSATIKERINPRLEKRLMPVRYWTHLPEKINH